MTVPVGSAAYCMLKYGELPVILPFLDLGMNCIVGRWRGCYCMNGGQLLPDPFPRQTTITHHLLHVVVVANMPSAVVNPPDLIGSGIAMICNDIAGQHYGCLILYSRRALPIWGLLQRSVQLVTIG